MALDYLPVQASAVPSEWVFSSSGETDTSWRNRIKPILMEALQTVKYSLKRDCLNFTKGWITSEELMLLQPSVDTDLLGDISGAHREEVLDRVLAALADDDEPDIIVVA